MSLTDYVLISQGEPRIEHSQRDEAGGWRYRAAVAGGRVRLTDGTVLEVDALFSGIFELPGD